MSTPNTPTEAHLELAKNALFARDASGRLMTAQMVAQLIADSEARVVEETVAAIIEKNAPEIAKANAALAVEREKVRVLRSALERRHDEQSYYCQYVEDALAATKEDSR